MQPHDQKKMLDMLDQQQHNQRLVNRVLKVILPIIAFLLSVICANLNWQSTLATFVILTITFYAVGIQRFTLWYWFVIIAIDVCIDNYLSYHGFDLKHLRFQLITMLVFTGIVGIGRPYIDRWLMKSKSP